jgi:hypothetical protein
LFDWEFIVVPFGIAPKGTKKSRQALIAPRILPANALQHSDDLQQNLGDYILYHF